MPGLLSYEVRAAVAAADDDVAACTRIKRALDRRGILREEATSNDEEGQQEACDERWSGQTR